MIALVKYEAARSALQACHDIDEVKDIRDKAQAMAAYAKQAKDTKLVEWASEIKVRAERRAGTMLSEMKINGARHDGRNIKTAQEYPEVTPEDAPTLETLGVSKKQSSTWQKVAAIPEEKFERAITQTKESAGVVTTAGVLRSAVGSASKPAAKQAKHSKSEPDPEAEKHAPNLADEFERADKQIREQQELIDSLKKDDLAKEVAKWKLKYDQLNGRVQQLATTTAAAKKTAQYQADLLAKIRKALKVQKNGEILGALKR